MTEQSRSKRPKRLSTRRNPEAFLYALSWQEERDIQRAMYKSLKESRGEPPPLSPPKAKEEEEDDDEEEEEAAAEEAEEEEEEEEKEEEKPPVRKSPRLRVPLRLDGTFGFGSNGGSNDSTRDMKASPRPLLMRASSSSAMEDGCLTPKGEGSATGLTESSRAPLGKKRILAPRKSMGEIPVELWVDPSGKPVVTRDFLDFLCFRGDQPLSCSFPGPPGVKPPAPLTGNAALPPKLAWFELPPQQRPQAKLFTTGQRGPAARTKVAARGKRTSTSGGLISDSSSNSGLSRRNSGQSSPSCEDNTTNAERASPRGGKEALGPRKKSRSLFYQIMTAKLRKLQSHANTHKRLARPSTSTAALSSPPAGPKAATTPAEKKAADADGRVRRSTRVQARQQHRLLHRDRLSLDRLSDRESSPPPPRRSLPTNVGAVATTTTTAKGRAERQMVTRQRAKDILLRAKTLRQR